jgi:hypothetical protein
MKVNWSGIEIDLGSLTSLVRDRAKWIGEDQFPSSHLWADEVERILSFAMAQGVFERYLGDLTGSKSQRDSALAELRVAFYFHRNQFHVSSWKPVGLPPKEGEFLIHGPSGVSTFVEVKSPGWEGELSVAERNAGRTKQPKHINAEARAISPWERIQFAVDKAYGKFLSTQPNLLVVADDLFVSLQHGTEMHAGLALYASHKAGRFVDHSFENLGGVGIFWVENNLKQVTYDMRLFLNPFSRISTTLPEDLRKAFKGVTEVN